MRFALLFIVFCCGALRGQETAPPKRWQVGLYTGIQLSEEEFTSLRLRSSYYQATLHYRLSRWVDLGGQVGFCRLAGQERSFGGVIDGSPLDLTYTQYQSNVLVGLQPRFNFRLGQGDLQFSPAFGVVHHRHRQEIINPGALLRGEVYFAPRTDPYYQLSLGYTYWTTRSLGLAAHLSLLTMEHGGVGPIEPGTLYELDRFENISEERALGIAGSSTHALLRPRTIVYGTVGVVWRPF